MRLRFGLGVQAALDAGIIRLQHIVIFPAVRTGLNDQITGGELAIIAISIAFASTVSNRLRP